MILSAVATVFFLNLGVFSSGSEEGLEQKDTSPLVSGVISTHTGSCTGSHRIKTSLAGLQTGTRSPSRRLLFILLVTAVPEAEADWGGMEKGWRRGKLPSISLPLPSDLEPFQETGYKRLSV